jgi:alpha-L-rhamnosidase
MKKYVDYLKNMSYGNILSHGLGDWYDLGPRFPGEAQLTPKEVTATSIWYYDAKLLGGMASLIGENEDSQYYNSLAEEIRIAFNRKFFNSETNVYSTGSQTAYAMPLFFGMVDDSCHSKVVNNLVTSIRNNNNALTAGDIGFRYLLRVLEEEGYSDVIYDMTSKSDVPGYGFQLSRGATSLTESWAGLREVSNNHMMLGHLMEWFYSGLGGIRQAPGSIGYDHILIQPEPAGDIKWAETTCRTIHGEVACSWQITGSNLILQVSIPPNCIATVVMPQADPGKITVGGSPLDLADNIEDIESSGTRTFIKISSGNYSFKSESQ